MAFCANCGAEVQGRFCPKCGAPAGAAAPPRAPEQPYAAPQQQQGYSPQAAPQAAGLTDNMAAALCYVLGLITGILFLVLAPYNQNRVIRFHAFQSIFLNLAYIAGLILLAVLTSILRVIPFVGVMLSLALYPLLALCFFVLWLVLMYKAYNGERWVLPIIGPLAEKQA
jgi:uncharacterized membrane protein